MSGLPPAWISPGRTALLIVDMQADFAAPDGRMAQWGADLSTVPAALAAADRLAVAARAAGVAVIFAGLETRPQTDSPAWAERLARQGQDPSEALALCRAGSPGARFLGPTPQAGDMVIAKTRYSAFFGADLEGQLRARGIDTLVLCGLTTESCVDSTARDAFHRDFHVFVVSDACAAYETDLHQTALKSLALNCALLTTAEAVVAAWAQASPQTTA